MQVGTVFKMRDAKRVFNMMNTASLTLLVSIGFASAK